MIFVISPAKALDFETRATTTLYTQPDYLNQADKLIQKLRTLTPDEIATLMKLSDPLAALNVARYASWARPFTPENAKQAVLAFNGDVYDGLDARTLTEMELAWAQRHLRILSGLYGILRPLDLMQAYRLEMGTRLETENSKNLYAFWGETQTQALNLLLANERGAGKKPVLLNLASSEYFKVLKADKLAGQIITPVFEDWKAGRYKIVSFYAKRARGLMSRFAITTQAETVAQLTQFNADGYAFDATASDDHTLTFRRRNN